jgi:PAS domain S-box-containing protein
METIIKTDPVTGARKARFPKYVFLSLFLPIALLVLVLGMSLATLRTDAHIKKILGDDIGRLNLVSGFLGAEVLSALQHLRSISTETIARQALNSGDPKHLQLLETSFLTLASRNPQYQQIRWINDSGTEVVRVMNNQGESYVVAAEELQDKSSRYYFKIANALLPGELYVSRVDLNVENGQVEIPIRPMLRIATPVLDSDQKHRGIFIINIEMKHLFNLIQAQGEAHLGAEYLLVNQQGDVLNGEVEAFEAAASEESMEKIILPDPKVREKVLTSESGTLELPGGLWTWKKLSPVATFNKLTRVFPKHLVAFDQLITDDFSMTLVSHRPLKALLKVRTENRLLVFVGVLFVLCIYAISLYFYLSGHVRARVAEIDAAQATARAASMMRLKELEERFHRLVDASSIGQLVVNIEGRIEISNPSAEQILGYERGELEGVLVDDLLPTGMQDKHAHYRKEFMQAPTARMMGTERELEAVRKEGSKIPVEVGLTPYTDHGQPLILVSLIDLSHRRISSQ